MSRERSMGSFDYPTQAYKTTTCAGAVSTVNNLLTTPIHWFGSTKTMIDNVTPGYERISARGGIVNSPMSITREARTASFNPAMAVRNAGCSGSTVKRYDWSHYSSSATPTFLEPSDTLLSSAKTEAYTAAVGSIDQPDIMGLVEAYEARRTITALGDVVLDFRRILQGIKRSLDFRNWCRRRRASVSWASLTQFLSAEWLRYRYFFLPLFLTAKSAYQALTSKVPPPQRQTWRGSAGGTETATTPVVVNEGYYFTTKYSSVQTVEVSARAGVLTELVRGKCLEVAGFGFQHIPSAVWELVSFSFVWDWIFNIGDFIAAVSPKVGIRSLCSWTTVTITQNTSWQVIAVPNNVSGWSISGGGGSGLCTRITTTRIPKGNVGITNRQFNGSLVDFIHLTDALALLRQFSR